MYLSHALLFNLLKLKMANRPRRSGRRQNLADDFLSNSMLIESNDDEQMAAPADRSIRNDQDANNGVSQMSITSPDQTIYSIDVAELFNLPLEMLKKECDRRNLIVVPTQGKTKVRKSDFVNRLYDDNYRSLRTDREADYSVSSDSESSQDDMRSYTTAANERNASSASNSFRPQPAPRSIRTPSVSAQSRVATVESDESEGELSTSQLLKQVVRMNKQLLDERAEERRGRRSDDHTGRIAANPTITIANTLSKQYEYAIPQFNGNDGLDPKKWAMQVEMVARANNYTEDTTRMLAASKLHGNAAIWNENRENRKMHQAVDMDDPILREPFADWKREFLRYFDPLYRQTDWDRAFREFSQPKGMSLEEFVHAKLHLLRGNYRRFETKDQLFEEIIKACKFPNERTVLLAAAPQTEEELLALCCKLDRNSPQVIEKRSTENRDRLYKKLNIETPKENPDNKPNDNKNGKNNKDQHSNDKSNSNKPHDKNGKNGHNGQNGKNDKKRNDRSRGQQNGNRRREKPRNWVPNFEPQVPGTAYPFSKEKYGNDTSCRICKKPNHTILNCRVVEEWVRANPNNKIADGNYNQRREYNNNNNQQRLALPAPPQRFASGANAQPVRGRPQQAHFGQEIFDDEGDNFSEEDYSGRPSRAKSNRAINVPAQSQGSNSRSNNSRSAMFACYTVMPDREIEDCSPVQHSTADLQLLNSSVTVKEDTQRSLTIDSKADSLNLQTVDSNVDVLSSQTIDAKAELLSSQTVDSNVDELSLQTIDAKADLLSSNSVDKEVDVLSLQSFAAINTTDRGTLLKIPILLNGSKYMYAMDDTCCTFSAISTKHTRGIQLMPYKGTQIRVLEKSVTPLGVVPTMRIKFGDQEYKLSNVVVIDDERFDMILGANWRQCSDLMIVQYNGWAMYHNVNANRIEYELNEHLRPTEAFRQFHEQMKFEIEQPPEPEAFFATAPHDNRLGNACYEGLMPETTGYFDCYAGGLGEQLLDEWKDFIDKDLLPEVSALEQAAQLEMGAFAMVPVDNPELPPDIQEIVDDNPNAVIPPDGTLGKVIGIKHKFVMEDDESVNSKNYRMTFEDREFAEFEINRMLGEDVIRPSTSNYSSPILIVKQPLHESQPRRFCNDFRKLNAKMKKEAFVPPQLDECISVFAGMKCHSSIDIKSAYWQIELEEECKPKTAFTSEWGSYEFNRMCFGLPNAPATCQRLTNAIVARARRRFKDMEMDKIAKICGYIDDFGIGTIDRPTMIIALRVVFEIIGEFGFRIALKKCVFAADKITFLGYIISAEGRTPDPRKLEGVKDFPVPRSIKNVQSFLGLTGYYRRFVKNYAQLSLPLNEIIRKHEFFWGEKQQKAFDQIKQVTCSPPVLAFFDPSKPIVLHVDASMLGLGAVLMQRDENKSLHLVDCASRMLKPHELNHHINDLEAIAACWALTEKFEIYVHQNTKGEVFTDSWTFAHALKKIKPSKRFLDVIASLQGFIYLEFKHFKGSQNRVADALSRNPIGLPPNVRDDDETKSIECYTVYTSNQSELKTEQSKDEFCSKRLKVLDSPLNEFSTKFAQRVYKEFLVENGVLLHKPRSKAAPFQLVIPPNLRMPILQRCHDDFGHFNADYTTATIQKRWWWPGMVAQILDYVRNCVPCSLHNRVTKLSIGLLHPREVPIQPFSLICTDHVGPLNPTENGNVHILVFVDYTTRFAISAAVPDTSAKTAIGVLYDQVICKFGAPAFAVHDAGSCFRSEEFQNKLLQHEIESIEAFAHFQQANGLAERTIQTLSRMLAKLVNPDMNDWDKFLPLVTFAYNATNSKSMSHAPFELLHGYTPRVPGLNWIAVTDDDLTLDDRRSSVLEKRADAVESLTSAQKRAKEYYDKFHREKSFQVGDRVLYVYYKQHPGSRRKLLPNYEGFYRIVEKDGDHYKIEKLNATPREKKIRDVHVSQLKRCPETDFGELPIPYENFDLENRDGELAPVLDELERIERNNPTRPNPREAIGRVEPLLADVAREDLARPVRTKRLPAYLRECVTDFESDEAVAE